MSALYEQQRISESSAAVAQTPAPPPPGSMANDWPPSLPVKALPLVSPSIINTVHVGGEGCLCVCVCVCVCVFQSLEKTGTQGG